MVVSEPWQNKTTMQNFQEVYVLFHFFLLFHGNCAPVKVEPFFNSPSLSVLCYKSGAHGDINDVTGSGHGPCPVPVPQLRTGRQLIGIEGDHYTEPPDWVNVTLASIGQTFMRKNLLGFLYSTGMSSLLVATSVDALRVIASAGNIAQPKVAARRYLGNVIHFLFWMIGDIGGKNSNGNPNHVNQSSLFETLNLIRSVHEKVSHQSHMHQELYTVPVVNEGVDNVTLNEPLWDAFQKDLESSPLAAFKNRPIFPPRDGGTEYYLNQFTMMLQYWAFVALPIMKPESALLISRPSEEELLGFLHFWGFLGHVMGLKPEYNICLQPDLPTAKLYFRELLEEYFAPGLFQMDYESKVVLEVSVKGIKRMFPFVDDSVTLHQVCEELLWVEPRHIRKVMSPQSRVYSSIFKIFRSFTEFPFSNTVIRFVIAGMVQVESIKQLGFNTLRPSDFTKGIIQYDEGVLESTNLWLNNTNSWTSR